MTLTTKQQAFVEAYLANGFNATKAAIEAGYSEKTARQLGAETLAKPYIREFIDNRLKQLAMGADEVLVRLSDHARADMGEFIDVDYLSIKTHPKSHLIKKVKRTVRTDKDGAVTEYTEIELHDPQAALVHLGRYHKLFVDRVQSDDWRTEAIDLIRRGELTFDALAEAFDNDLASQLFREAGVPVQTRKS